jgi:hypothetical protein
MGNHFCHAVLAPSVTRDQIEVFVKTLRSELPRPVVVTLCDFSNKKVRKQHYVAAKSAGVRILEIETRLGHKVLIPIAVRAFGSAFLYREEDDEDIDVCYPDADWLSRTFNTDGLAWLLELPDEPVPWNRESFYALPGNPPNSSITLGISSRFLVPSLPGQMRQCPLCGTEYLGKRERGQCPNRDCLFVWEPFSSRAEAIKFSVEKLDAFSWGQCPRCRKRLSFTHKVEQCQRCGQLMIESGSRHPLSLIDNCAEVQRFIIDTFRHS